MRTRIAIGVLLLGAGWAGAASPPLAGVSVARPAPPPPPYIPPDVKGFAASRIYQDHYARYYHGREVDKPKPPRFPRLAKLFGIE